MAALSKAFFSNSNSSSSHNLKKLCRFEIRTEHEYVFLRGNSEETSDFTVRGHVVLMTSDTLQTKGVKVTLEGKRRTSHQYDPKDYPPTTGSTTTVNKRKFLEEEVKLEVDGGPIKTLKPGNYEFPFSITLPGNTPETVEGFRGGAHYISYELKAVADRGLVAKDLVTKKHIRIIRTLSEDALELLDPNSVPGFWPDKIKYEFSTNAKAAVFGDSVFTDISLTPLMEKLEITSLKISLKETLYVKTIPGPPLGSIESNSKGMWKSEYDVASMKMDIPPDSLDTDPELQLPMFKFKSKFVLPKSLVECRQSVEKNEWIRTKHVLHYVLLLKNPDGHYSELRAHHPMRLFISPNLPIGDNDTVVEDPGVHVNPSNGQETDLMDDMRSAPPNYGSHRLDRLYEDVDTNGLHTPFPQSGAATPRAIDSSRPASNDNLVGMAHDAESLPQALANRLRTLQMDEPTMGASHYSNPASAEVSADPSRNNSYSMPVGMTLAQHYEGSSLPSSSFTNGYDMDSLERIETYDTAVRMPVRTPFTEAPPNYDTATSRPPSPPPQVPRPAHTRNG